MRSYKRAFLNEKASSQAIRLILAGPTSFPYYSAAMSGHFAPLFCLIVCCSFVADPAWADQPSAGDAEQFVVLRNGEVLSGHVARQGDRCVVTTSNSEIRVPTKDVDFTCKSLDEAYQLQRNRVIAGRIDDHLNLADWCLRQNLVGYAAREIAAAMDIDPRSPRVAVLDRRLKREQELTQGKQSSTVSPAATAPIVSPDELERLVRSLPGNTVEAFTLTIQPMLLNNCATAGCHGPSPASKYVLLRPGIGEMPQRRLTQRNLYNTLSWTDHTSPADSKLLAAAKQPHGTDQASAAALSATQYQELAAWVIQATQGIKTRAPLTANLEQPAADVPQSTANVIDNPNIAQIIVPEAPNSIAPKVAARKAKKVPSIPGAPNPGGNVKSVIPLPTPTEGLPPNGATAAGN
jgi:hypothetical protein